MARIKKKGTSGNAKNFITRSRAISELQVSLADFRRLCIFKGIYPRVPRNKKKANRGSKASTTFYYTKDIKYLMHEPLINKFREHKTFAKKLSKALGRGEVGDAKRLEENRPRYKLDRIIKERYPSFIDALRDLDDALNMLFLFSNMRATTKVHSKVVRQATELTNQWMAYIARQGALKKVFVSIKGVYYSANIKGQEIIWLVPFKFPQNIPSDIDFKVMVTFLEFYATLLHFVLYRLYTEAGLVYPPKINESRIKGIGGLTAYVLQNREETETGEDDNLLTEKDAEESASNTERKLTEEEISMAVKADKREADADKDNENENEQEKATAAEEEEKLDEFVDENKIKGDTLLQPKNEENEASKLFSNFVFYIGREVPVDILEFVILSAGGKVISEAALDEYTLNGGSDAKVDLSSVTHQIVDRPKIAKKFQGRTYIQPQWVFDSVNKEELQSVSDYAPGETLPPHLSPWGDSGIYNPAEPITLEKSEEEEEVSNEGDGSDKNEDVEEDKYLEAQKELELEASGVAYSDIAKDKKNKQNGKGKKRKLTEAEEEKELKLMMMTKKQRGLYKRMKYGQNKEEVRKKELQKKRVQLQKSKEKLGRLNQKK
ncbi:NOP7 [Brettanomyces bruxellensis]|uniref:Pescadillo homolog n=1 Tax=Dekkera bruxellensis TaxID=5007 RepID=A0A7D9CZ28_DEKBR|nr:NOP7 [Brettanomyces bruxellensis]